MKPLSSHQLATQWLHENFPKAFFRQTKEIKPLQIGIFEELLPYYERMDIPCFSKRVLREALSYYSRSKAYLMAQVTNAPRYDLFGNAVDTVTEEQANYAKTRYQKIYLNKNPSE